MDTYLHRMAKPLRQVLAGLGALLLGACGDGGSDDSDGGGDIWSPGSFAPSAGFAALCAMPRSGINPATGYPYDDLPGSTVDENNWLRSWSTELYLWYDEIVDRDPALYSPPAYFDLQKTEERTASGTPKDQFHFSYPSAEWLDLSQSGVSAGYGAEWAYIESRPPREILVAYTQPNSPATSASVNLVRGARVLSVDGEDLVNGTDVDTLNAGLAPARAGETHTFMVQDPGSAVTRTISMTSANVVSSPVQNVQTYASSTGRIGYMLFNEHIATAEAQLIDGINQLARAGIVDLVLDLRYNGGGYLAIASQLAYMIAGPAATGGRVFESSEFNDKYPDINPVTGQALVPMPFFSTTLGFSTGEGHGLPTLNLRRVFVITGSDTCSASEAIINGLRGVGIEVIQVGSTTCGKPYGFYATDNCGTTYFSIQFRGVNDLGFGDYSDGFSPANTMGVAGERIPGCEVADDFSQALGDVNENRLETALAYINNGGVCPAAVRGLVLGTAGLADDSDSAGEGVLKKTPFHQNRIMGEPR